MFDDVQWHLSLCGKPYLRATRTDVSACRRCRQSLCGRQLLLAFSPSTGVLRNSRLPSPGINCCLVEGCQEILSLDLPGCYVTDCPCGSPIETLLLYCPAHCCCLGCHSKPACSCVIKTNLLRKSSHLLFFVTTPYHLLTSWSTRLDQHLSGLLTPLIT